LRSDSVAQRWTPIAKDGAELPPALQRERASTLPPRTPAGDTFDDELP
jgi:hypothetical protein